MAPLTYPLPNPPTNVDGARAGGGVYHRRQRFVRRGHAARETRLKLRPCSLHLGSSLSDGEIVRVDRPVDLRVLCLTGCLELTHALQGVGPCQKWTDQRAVIPLRLALLGRQAGNYGLRACFQADHHARSPEKFPVGGVHHGAAARGDDDTPARAGLGKDLPLHAAKGGLAVLGEDGLNGPPGAAHDLHVVVHEPPTVQAGNLTSDGGLPRAGKAYQDDVGRSATVLHG